MNLTKADVDHLRRLAEQGMTALEAAEVLGIADSTARRKAKRHGFKFRNARHVQHEKLRANNEQRKQELFKARLRKNVDRVKKQMAHVTDPAIRREILYGQALLAFEKKQSRLNRRPDLPINESDGNDSVLLRKPVNNYKPLEIHGVRFDSRTAAADALNISRPRLSSLISEDATYKQQDRLLELIQHYKARRNRVLLSHGSPHHCICGR